MTDYKEVNRKKTSLDKRIHRSYRIPKNDEVKFE